MFIHKWNKDIFILSVFIVSIIYVLDRLYIDTEMYGISTINYNKIKKFANTGDLIIFRWNTIDVGFRLFSKFSHVGMIVKKNNKLYLLETHPKEHNEFDDSGVHLYHLKSRLDEYNGECYFSQIQINKNKREEITTYIFDNLKQFKKNMPFDTNFRNIFVLNYFCNLLNLDLPEKKGMFCSEFIGTILQDTGTYHHHHKNLASLNPGSFIDLKKNNKSLYHQLYRVIL